MKKVISLVMAASLLATVFAGCSSSSSSSSAKKSEGGEIVIGVVQDLSGTTSVLGNAVKNGAELAVEKINAAGGVDGKKIKLISYDVKGDPQEALNSYKRLVDQDKAVAVVGPPVSNIGLALAPIANQKKVPVVGSYIDPRVTQKEDGSPQDYMFMMQPSSVQNSELLASYGIDKLGVKNIALFYDQTNAFAVSLMKPFKDYLAAHGGKIVAEEVYKKGDKDYKTQLNKIKTSGADAIYAPNYTQDNILTVQQANQIGLKLPIIGGLDYAPPFASLMNDPTLADNIYFANNYSDNEPQLKDVREAYKAKFKEDPINKAYLGYDTITIIANAIKTAGKADATAIKDALEKTKDLQCTTGKITLDPKTHATVGLTMVVYKIEKGKYIEIGRHAAQK
jgi:branched-chain amino acid transport system substrate-binding protein